MSMKVTPLLAVLPFPFAMAFIEIGVVVFV